MAGKLTKSAYTQLISEDLLWLEKQPHSIEKTHIKEIVMRSINHEYPNLTEAEKLFKAVDELPDKICMMQCGKSSGDTRSWEEIMRNCNDCIIN